MSFDVPCFVLNLKRSPDRRERITSSFNRLRIPFEFIDAVDGVALSATEIKKVVTSGYSRNLGFKIPPGYIGCTLSHRIALQTIVERGIDVGIVFEDDTDLSDDFAERVGAALAAPCEWDVLKLGSVLHEHARGKILARSTYGRIVRLPIPSYLANAYAVSNIGARKLVSALFPVREFLDLCFQAPWRTGVDVCELLPYPARPTDVPSTAGRSSLLDQKNGLSRTLRRLPARIDRSVGRRLHMIRWFGWKAAIGIEELDEVN
jgi:glycosyl transferase, family 25